MKSHRVYPSLGALAATSFLALLTFTPPARSTEKSIPAQTDARVERGRYLVHGVGLCVDCHSPRGADGNFIADRHLTGAPIPFSPNGPMPWMPVAPRIAGLPAGYSESDLVHFLMSGERPNGRPPVLPPMPPYRLNQADAEAVAAYLKSLPAL